MCVALAAILLLSGCSRTLEIEAIRGGFPQAVLVERLPLLVGVYYAAEFRAQRSRGHLDFPVGEASIALFDRVLAAMFEGVVQLGEPPLVPPREPGLAAVIAPRIQKVTAKFGEQVTVTYGIEVWSPRGSVLAVWAVSGVGGKIYGVASDGKMRDGVASALRNAVGRFAVGFRDQPRVAEWLASRGLGS